MKKIYLFLSLAASQFVAQAQISAPTSSAVLSTAYTNGSPNDPIYIFCGTAASLTGTSPTGTGAFTFSWSVFNPVTYTYDPFSSFTGASSTIGGLTSGGYMLNVTNALGNTVFCGRAWVFNNVTSADAGTLSPACGGNITLNGMVDALADFTYYNPPAQNFQVGPSTQITVCLDATHTQVSDLGFYLVGPASCGSPIVTLCPSPVSTPLCNTGNDVSNLCFSSASVSSFDICAAATPLTGAYGAYASGPINWSPLYGCNVAGPWLVQVFDCNPGETGTLTGAHLEFFDPMACHSFVEYGAAPVSESIVDMACSNNSAMLYTLPAVPADHSPLTLGNSITGFEWTAADGIPVPGSTSSLNPVLPAPGHDNWYYLEATDNFGCTHTDSVLFDNNCPCSLSLTANPSGCDSLTNEYTLDGELSFDNPPASGTLTVTTSCGGMQVFYPPFVSPLVYSITGLDSDGLPCTAEAHFSDSAACADTVAFTAPAFCHNNCIVLSVTSEAVNCDTSTMTYSVTGTVTFANPPATGILRVKASCMPYSTITSVVDFYPPFTSPVTYTLTGMYPLSPGSAGPCNVIAVFMDEPDCAQVVNYDAPVLPFFLGDIFCVYDEPEQLEAFPLGGVYWGSPAVDSSGMFDPAVATPGLHTIHYMPGGTCVYPTQATQTVVAVSQLSILMPYDSVICYGETVNVTVGGAESPSEWHPNSTVGATGSPGEFVLFPTHTTTYTIYNNNSPCPDVAQLTIQVLPVPDLTVNTPPVVCPGESVVLVANGAIDYSWSPATGLSGLGSNVVTASPPSTTQYTVYGTGANGCATTTDVTVTIANPSLVVEPLPAVGVAPLNVYFDNQSSAMTYYWDFGNGQTAVTYSSNSDASMVYTEPGIYTVTVISVLGNCTDTLRLTIEVLKPDSNIELPNIITANGDGINDVFRINAVQIVSMELKIFNRWGQEVGLITQPDGVWTGEGRPEGTYYYTLKAIGLDKESYDLNGFFQLVR